MTSLQGHLPFFQHPGTVLVDAVVIDIEGNGRWGKDEDIVELAAISFWSLGEIRHWLVKPGISISKAGTRIHGIRNSDVIDRPTMLDVSSEITQFLNARPIIAHNAQADCRLLKKTIPSLSMPLVFDTLRLARSLIPNERHYGLSTLVSNLNLLEEVSKVFNGGCHQRRDVGMFHGAIFDAFATAFLFRTLRDVAERRCVDWYQLARITSVAPAK